MSEYGLGPFHIHYKTVDGRQFRKAYRTMQDAEKARNFLEALGIFPEIDIQATRGNQ